MPPYNKPPLSLKDQLWKLKARGVHVEDDAEALHCLKFIGYYRLSAYALSFQDNHQLSKSFVSGASFGSILDLYRFDRELRLLAMDAIERIEVAVRSCFVNELSLKYGSHWYLSRAYFLPTYNHARLIRNIESNLEIDRATKTTSKKHQEVFINHYFSKYHTPYLPPIWMVCECLSFGTWSLMYSNLVDKADRKLVSDHFGVDVHLFLKWLTSLNQVRNICAHHGRFWNRQFSMKFDVLKVHRALVLGNDRFYAFAVICYFLLQGISPATDWNRKLYDLLGRFPHVDLSSMGFRPNWHLEPFWALY